VRLQVLRARHTCRTNSALVARFIGFIHSFAESGSELFGKPGSGSRLRPSVLVASVEYPDSMDSFIHSFIHGIRMRAFS
jgi:hypothetical protein